MVIEPIASVVLSPYGGNPDDVPNEDSVSFEFDATNVLRPNRFTGLDRVEGGPRLNYGFRFGLYDPDGGYATAMFGQSLRVKADTTFADKTGLEDRRSDFVGRLAWAPSTLLDLSNRFRLDRDTFSIRRNEIKLSAGPKLLRADVDYVSLARELTADELTSREEINFRGRLQVTRYWAVDTNTRRDLSGDGDTLDYGFGIMYEDECFIFSSRFERDFTADRDVQPSTSLNFKIRLKHLG
jgi:LPS-assembly protein